MLTEDNTVCGAVYREDVAQLVVKALLSPKAAYKVRSGVLGQGPTLQGLVLARVCLGSIVRNQTRLHHQRKDLHAVAAAAYLQVCQTSGDGAVF